MVYSTNLITLLVLWAFVPSYLCEFSFSKPLFFRSQKMTLQIWDTFKLTYNKIYSQDEELFRINTFTENLQYINEHNQRYALNLETFTLGVNFYADWTHEEFSRNMLGMRIDLSDMDQFSKLSNDTTTYLEPENMGPLPDSVNWTAKGYVTPVKNQGQCGSCWAFSATGSIEGQYFRKTKKLVSLSEQNLVDCSQKQGNFGCDGGYMDKAFKYVIQNGGIDTEIGYPYTAKSGPCRFNKNAIGATIKSYTDITRGSELNLQTAVATVGPISVAIDASHMSFQFYKSGVYNERKCNSNNLDHGVLAVGYGTVGGTAYWLVKNSWGKTWGMQGYILMSRNKQNQCGIASMASYPVV